MVGPERTMTSRAAPTLTMATADDLADVVALLSAQFDEHGIDAGDVARGARGLIESPERGAIFLATVDGTRVGIAAMPFTWTLEHGGLVAWLDELYVLPSMRDRGIGRALLDHVLAAARAAGCLAIDLEVDTSHARVERLYERRGFTRLPRTRFALRLT